jgi:MFS family permease
MSQWLPSVRGLPRAFWLLVVGVFVNRVGSFVVPFLSIYLTKNRHLSVEQAGFIVTLFGVGTIASGPVAGALADRFGRRPTMLASCLLGAAAMAQVGLARSIPHLAVATLLLGFCGDLYRAPMQAMVADLIPAQDRTRAYGITYWAVNFGFAVAAVVGGLFAEVSFTPLFIGDAATTLGLGAIVYFCVPETRAPQKSDRGRDGGLLAPYTDGVFLAFAALTFGTGMIFQQAMVGLPMDMVGHGLSPRLFGFLIALNGVLIILLQPIAVQQVQRFRRSHVLSVGALATGAGFGLFGLARGPALFAIGILVFTVGEIMMAPVNPTVVSDLAPPTLRGSYQGAFQLSWGAAALVAPTVGTQLLGHFGGRALWGGCLLLGIAVAVGQQALAGARRRRLVERGPDQLSNSVS